MKHIACNPLRITLQPHILNAFVKGPEGLDLPLMKGEVKEYTFAREFDVTNKQYSLQQKHTHGDRCLYMNDKQFQVVV